jgi:hypothetical protein
MKEFLAGIINSIKSAPFAMYAASEAEDFVKIWAEYEYDKIAKTAYFQKLQDMEKKD